MKNLIKATLLSFVLLHVGLSNAMKKEVSFAERDKLNKQLLDSVERRDNYVEVSRLIRDGADVEIKEKILGRTPLITTAYHGHLQAMRALLEAGANANATSDFLATPLHLAVSGLRPNPEAVKMLLNNKANVDAMDGHIGQNTFTKRFSLHFC